MTYDPDSHPDGRSPVATKDSNQLTDQPIFQINPTHRHRYPAFGLSFLCK